MVEKWPILYAPGGRRKGGAGWLLQLLMALLLLVPLGMAFVPSGLAQAAVLYEALSSGDNAYGWSSATRWEAQSFTTVGGHFATSVRLKMFILSGDTPGRVTVSIRATDGSGYPTGSDMASGIADGDTFTTSMTGEWREFVFNKPCLLAAATKYTLVIRSENATDFANIKLVTTGGYSGGNRNLSMDTGVTWTPLTSDMLFEVYGVPPRLYEHYTTGDNTTLLCGATTWLAQTFTTGTGYKISHVRLQLARSGSPGNVTVSIRATDNITGRPVGSDLASYIFNGDTLPTVWSAAWKDVFFSTPRSVNAATTYAIVVRCVTAASLHWNSNSSGGYAGGKETASSNSGSTWADGTRDLMFEVWGEKPSLWEANGTYNAGGAAGGLTWWAQTFTTGSRAHSITSARWYGYTLPAAGPVTVSIRATDGSGHPTGSDLVSGVLDGKNTGSTGWNVVPFDRPLTANSNTKYAMVIRAQAGSSIMLNINIGDVFAGGNMETSTDGGSTWISLGDDLPFEIYGLRPGDIGAYQAGTWYLDFSSNGAWNGAVTDRLYSFGNAAMKPVTGDWNGDGLMEIGAYNSGTWYGDFNGNGIWNGPVTDRQCSFGNASMTPVSGDWDGNGNTEIGTFLNGAWYIDYNANGVWNGTGGGDKLYTFGNSTMKPVTGDWNGDGKTEVGTFLNGAWYIDYNGSGTWNGTAGGDKLYTFGNSTMKPVSGDWNADGRTEIGTFLNGAWYLDYNGNGVWNNVAGGDKLRSFGNSAMTPVNGSAY